MTVIDSHPGAIGLDGEPHTYTARPGELLSLSHMPGDVFEIRFAARDL